LFNRPKPTVGCSANGKRRRRKNKLRRMKWPEHIGNMGQIRHYFGQK
jgi:hypothetical protein